MKSITLFDLLMICIANINMNKLEQLQQKIKQFISDRDWDQFHSPENLAKSVVIEAAELLECF